MLRCDDDSIYSNNIADCHRKTDHTICPLLGIARFQENYIRRNYKKKINTIYVRIYIFFQTFNEFNLCIFKKKNI